MIDCPLTFPRRNATRPASSAPSGARLACNAIAAALLAAVGLAATAGAGAASLTVQLDNAAGAAVADAAVYAEPAGGQTGPRQARRIDIEQKGRKFLPLMTVVQTGTEISFPNNDSVRHQVYSFSPPKVFELKLYSGTPGAPILFDKPGSVVVGCNIHDQMIAYIHIVNTPFFAKTDAAGRARLDNLPPGKYLLKAWHYNLAAGATAPEKEIVVAGADQGAALSINTRAVPAAN
jgi:plastocyanin